MNTKLLTISVLIIIILGSIRPIYCEEKPIPINPIVINWEGDLAKLDPEAFPDRNPERFLVKITALKKADLEKIVIQFKKVAGKTEEETITFDNANNQEILRDVVESDGNNLSFNIIDMLEKLANDEEKTLTSKVLNAFIKSKFIVKIYGPNRTGESPFLLTLQLTAKEVKETTGTDKPITLNQLPFPVFTSNNTDEWDESKKNRLLFIDASRVPTLNVGTVLYKRKTESGNNGSSDEPYVKVNSLDSRGNLKILIRADNFSSVEHVSINVAGENYVYEQDLSAFSSQFKMPKNLPEDSKIVKIESDENKKETTDQYFPYLNSAYQAINKNKKLNIEDIYVLNLYKKQLKTFTDNLKDSLSPASLGKLGEIMSWYPEYVFLNSKAVEVPDDDEVAITLQLKREGNKTEDYKIGTYKTKGGMGFNFGSMFYVTGLSINDVYTKQVFVNDSTTEKHATMDLTNKVSVGIGMNAEIYFRTGSLVKPTINIGFFVPLGQELTPYLAVGPGLTIGNKKVKFSLNGGFAFGQVNTIADRYKDVDVSDVEDITSLSRKVWKPSWYGGIGVSFNISK